MSNIALILGGGTGSRMNQDIPKQLNRIKYTVTKDKITIEDVEENLRNFDAAELFADDADENDNADADAV